MMLVLSSHEHLPGSTAAYSIHITTGTIICIIFPTAAVVIILDCCSEAALAIWVNMTTVPSPSRPSPARPPFCGGQPESDPGPQ